MFLEPVPTGGDAVASPASLVRTGDGKGRERLAEGMDPRTMGVPTEACHAGVSTIVAGMRGEGFQQWRVLRQGYTVAQFGQPLHFWLTD